MTQSGDLVKIFKLPPLLSHRSRPPKIHTNDKKATQYSILHYAVNPVFFKIPILPMPRRTRGTRTCVKSPNRSASRRSRLGDDTRLATYELRWIWDLVKFSNIFQLLHRVTKLMECMPHNPTNTMGDSRFHQKFQPADAHRLPHGGFAHRAETPRYGRSGT